MAKFRYWKLTIEEMEKVVHDEDKVLNWDIKCIKEPEEDALFFGIFLYKAGTPHDYESKKGLTYYYNNIERRQSNKFKTNSELRYNILLCNYILSPAWIK